MSFSVSSIRYLAWLHKKYGLYGNILLLGRQKVFCSKSLLNLVLEIDGAKIHIPSLTEVDTNCPISGPDSKHISDKFALMTIANFDNIQVLDISNYQGADIIHDLNLEVPTELHSKFDLIIDGGTLEHIYNIPVALKNISMMLKHGGRVIHMSPVSGYIDHGFYQISPLLYYSFYKENWRNQECLLVQHPSKKPNYKQWNFWYWNSQIERKRMLHQEPLACNFTAIKNNILGQEDSVPSQDFSTNGYVGEVNKSFETTPWGLRPVIELLPNPAIEEAIKYESIK
ncbi:class I SAM-dependent methyltransferase [Acinetobacter baumannii]|uniref:class I SAM-dependent methyltransferase n=1 Tax=Acinetobacter baumannii TaxID=470 RepID=UPI002340CABC|nr:class I SAM-dependent methyltransferase [Acinetobacter baumannii]